MAGEGVEVPFFLNCHGLVSLTVSNMYEQMEGFQRVMEIQK